MKVIEKIHTDNQKFPPMAIALGYFDGIHLGHQHLIKTMKKIAEEKNLKSAVFTFKTHPLSIISPEHSPKLLFSSNKKIKTLQSLGIDFMIYPNFSREIMNEQPEEFVKRILVNELNAKQIVVGFNYTFGYKGKGTASALIEYGKKYGFDVTVIDPVKINGQIVSSTLVRKLIKNGDMNLAEKCLGETYSIMGRVIPGKGLGKKISIPTANIKTENTMVVPKNGVYHTLVQYNDITYNAITNVGSNPTFSNHPFRIESFIFDFDKDIYGEEIEIFFKKRIRPEVKFSSIEDMVAQIKRDIASIKNYSKSPKKIRSN